MNDKKKKMATFIAAVHAICEHEIPGFAEMSRAEQGAEIIAVLELAELVERAAKEDSVKAAAIVRGLT